MPQAECPDSVSDTVSQLNDADRTSGSLGHWIKALLGCHHQRAGQAIGVCWCSGVRFGGEGFVEVLAATQTPTDKEWFQGTADAVRQYAWLFEDIKNRVVQDIVILSGDHL